MAFPFIILSLFFFADNSMDQDVYGGYSKQQIGSLTTDGEGEFFVLVVWNIRKELAMVDLQPTCIPLAIFDGHK